MNAQLDLHNQERAVKPFGGLPMLFLNIGLLLGGVAVLIHAGVEGSRPLHPAVWWQVIIGILMEIAGVISLGGHFTLQPNSAKVLILFGAYHGTVRESGFHWANPFYSKADTKISLRTRNFNSEKLEVNDKRGNP